MSLSTFLHRYIRRALPVVSQAIRSPPAQSTCIPRSNITYNNQFPIKYHFQHRWLSSRETNEFIDPNPLAAQAESLLTSVADPHGDPLHDDIQKAYNLLTEAVKQNSPRAKTLLASLYREGVSVSQDIPAALRLFLEAANDGDPIAQCSLGVLQLQLVEQEMNEGNKDVIGTELYVHKNEKGEQRAHVELEMSDGEKFSDAPTPAELVRKVRKARRKAGFSDAQSREFEQYKQEKRSQRINEQKEIALTWLQRAADQGNTTAMVRLANEIVRQKPHDAMIWYERAIKKDRNTDAYFNLGQIYAEGVDGVPADQKTALKNFAMAAQLGDASAQFYLGHLYRIGSASVNVDLASSRQYIQLAVDQGHPGAEYYLALMYRNGEGGLEVSESAFRKHLYASAASGHGPANSCLADMYYKGSDGVKVDYQEALKYFLKAGELGEENALCSAAAIYFHGIGVEEDKHHAFLLYQEAIKLGSVQALRSVGSMYYHGHGVPANKKIAQYFFQVADETEQTLNESEREHENKPIERTDAPKHPMADIPRFTEDVSPFSGVPDEPDDDSSTEQTQTTTVKPN